MEASVQAVIQYLSRDSKHDIEKPYYLHYDYDFDLPRTNTKLDLRRVEIHNARNLTVPAEQQFSECGFTMMPVQCPLSHQEYYDKDKVKTLLYPTFVELLKKVVPDAVRIEVLEHAVSQVICRSGCM